jgi:hypothetical protein
MASPNQQLYLVSDSQLAFAVGANVKWLYNASARLRRPLERTLDGVIWWRLVHQLSVDVGAPLASAAKAAGTVLEHVADSGRIHLHAAADQSVAVVVDLPKLHDTASLAAAAAAAFIVARPRGRPRKHTVATVTKSVARLSPERHDAGSELRRVLTAVHQVTGPDSLDALHLSRKIASVGVPFVLIGDAARAMAAGLAPPGHVDLVVDLTPRTSRSLATILAATHSRPRGVSARAGFVIDPAAMLSLPCLALDADGLRLNVWNAGLRFGGFEQQLSTSRVVELEGTLIRIAATEPFGEDLFTRLVDVWQ